MASSFSTIRWTLVASLLTVSAIISSPIPAAASTWTVSLVSSSTDTLWVDLRIASVNHNNECETRVCVEEHVYYDVTPCPLRIVGIDSGLCDVGSSILDSFPSTGFRRIALSPGITYTFSGYFETLGWGINPTTHMCDVLLCTYQDHPADKMFGGPLAATPVTWAAVKARYRSP